MKEITKDPEEDNDDYEDVTEEMEEATVEYLTTTEEDEDEDDDDDIVQPVGGQEFVSHRPDLTPSTKSPGPSNSNTPPSASQVHTGPVDMVMGMLGLAKNYCVANGGKCRHAVVGCRKWELYLEERCGSVWKVCCGKPMSRALRSKSLILRKFI